MSSIPARLAAIRQGLKKYDLAAYLVPSSDPHQSEYPPQHWTSRAWLSGFTGSAGTLIVTSDAAGLWTDSRYFLQAEQELRGSGIELHKQQIPYAPEHLDWLAQNLAAGSRLGFDGQVVSLSQYRALKRKLSAHGIELDGSHDLIAEVWTDRPGLPTSDIFELPTTYAGESRSEKLLRLRGWLDEHRADALFLVALDDIAWTLNIRAADVDFNPLCLSYLVVTRTQVHWFVGSERVGGQLRQRLTHDGVQIAEYSQVAQYLHNFPSEQTLAVDPATISVQHYYGSLKGKQSLEAPSPVQAMKSVKNPAEITHTFQAMRKDGVALLRLFCWLEQELLTRGVTEVEVADKLTSLRAAQPGYFGDSFPAIVGYQGNGAIVHYHAQADSCATIQAEGILLLDSGGQYWDGTTDITRTVALGPTTAEQRAHFTRVLKGMIALSEVRFPEGTTGGQLDVLARQHLWAAGLNYGHGTGHGVGFFLSVHEGPQGISPSLAGKAKTAFRVGMITSNEPGFYREGHYGIRIENLVLCEHDQKTPYGTFLRFRTLTLFPIDRKLIERSMLTEGERRWLNHYHAQVERELSPLLAHKAEQAWLRQQCAPI
ncbi:MAG: aminopeptidase P family protein [Bacteroidetes bacterium]|nr:MAG: aminopeptidase P family protein [Bacteroidota bacterium]